MPHPLIGNLEELPLAELHSKFNELSKKLFAAYKMGMSDVVPQLQNIIQDYQYEITRRSNKEMVEMMEKNPNFKNIIDIN